MPQPRLLSLWPSAFRYSNNCVKNTLLLRASTCGSKFAGFAPRSIIRQRHGPAVDPSSLFNDVPGPILPPKDIKDLESKVLSIAGKQANEPKSPEASPLGGAAGFEKSSQSVKSDVAKSSTPAPAPPPPPPPPLQTSNAVKTEEKAPSTAPPPQDVAQSPEASPQPSSSPAPHHYFDTYTIVSRLQSGGFTKPQSVTTMELIRTLLFHHLSQAKENLVSRSHFENNSYLFRAACSELRSEIQTLRQTQMEKLRSERQAVQTEFDMLNQRFMEEVMGLKNELNGMFNDRKMANRADQRTMENKIQELNYKITVMINSDLKSDIERLRWVTTRRALTAIGLLASFIVAMIKFAGNKKDKAKKEQSLESILESDAGGGAGIGFPKHTTLTTDALLSSSSAIPAMPASLG